jgi:hypothetical protein
MSGTEKIKEIGLILKEATGLASVAGKMMIETNAPDEIVLPIAEAVASMMVVSIAIESLIEETNVVTHPGSDSIN